MLDRIRLLRNIGQFDSIDAGAQLALTKLSLFYAENGRGKTTLATILRSLATSDAGPINERQRLGSQHPPHIVISSDAASYMFQNGAWNAVLPLISVFDDVFVAQNVCSGIEIETLHRQNLHELILGSQGVQLNTTLLQYVASVEQHNRTLRERSEALPAALRGALSIDEFCALPVDPDIGGKIHETEWQIAAARAEDTIRTQDPFMPFDLPAFDQAEISALLERDLPNLEAAAAQHVQTHVARLGRGGENWVSEGMSRIALVSADADHDICPFCAQNLAGVPLIQHYQAYFGVEYDALKTDIAAAIRSVEIGHSADVASAFERSIRVAGETRVFWARFAGDIPVIETDTAAIARAWNAARAAVLGALRAKQGAPLEATALSEEAVETIATYEEARTGIADLSRALQAANTEIAVVKERAAGANVAALTADLQRLHLVQVRHAEPASGLCDAYLAEKQAKAATERLRDQARSALDQYRQNVFPAYETAINDYLQRFNAGFRLGAVTSVNNRGGSAASYNVVINATAVALTAEQGPSFRNTLSAGDRNTLALAFFFASLEQDPHLADKIVVIDDPMTSLDEHRSLTTVQELRRLLRRVDQMIVLSHSKTFLFALWKDADTLTRSAIRIARSGSGSTFAAWDVNQDAVTEHDRRHALVTEYIQNGGPATERAAAEALRPILEAFLRVAFPGHFPPEMLLGPFINLCRRHAGTPQQVLSPADLDELDALREYGNRFHHDSNAAWQTAAINDQELTDFCVRTLAFARR